MNSQRTATSYHDRARLCLSLPIYILSSAEISKSRWYCVGSLGTMRSACAQAISRPGAACAACPWISGSSVSADDTKKTLAECSTQARLKRMARRQSRFLRLLLGAAGGDATAAAKAAKVPLSTLARWRRESPDVQAGFDQARHDLLLLEAERSLREIILTADPSTRLKATMFALSSLAPHRWGYPSWRRIEASMGADADAVAAALLRHRDLIDNSFEGPPAVPANVEVNA